MPIVLKSGSLNLLEPSGPAQACNGVALSLRKVKKYLKEFRMSEPGPEYGESRTQFSIANHNKKNFGNMEYLSRGFLSFFLPFLFGVDNESFSKRYRREFVDKPKRILLSLC